MKIFLLLIIRRLLDYRFTWKTRTFFRKIQHFFLNIFYQISKTLKETGVNLSILGSIIRVSLKSAVPVFLISAALLWITNNLPTHISINFQSLLSNNLSIDSYDNLLTLTITIFGLFLTLYLSNISVVAGASYSNFPRNIRELYIRERISDIYLQLLLLSLLMTVVFLGFAYFLDLRTNLFLLIIGLFSLFSIQAFLTLGKHTFRLFDPTYLIDTQVSYLFWFVKYATVDGLFWKNNDFQKYYQGSANRAANLIIEILNYAEHSPNLRREIFSENLVKLPFIVSWIQH